ncbi:MAG: hypothetical protein QOD96_7382, partial [Pseudonocardiales bacterium]|nr:hypothetical protein [Pseudonocardiales bacterium]
MSGATEVAEHPGLGGLTLRRGGRSVARADCSVMRLPPDLPD